MRRLFWCMTAAIALLIAPSVAQASPILVPTTPGITGSILVLFADPANPTIDVRGTVHVDVTEQTTSENLGGGFLLGVGPYPENQLVLTNTAIDQAITLLFDFSSSSFNPSFPGPLWTVNLISGTPITAISDPALIGFAGLDFAQFSIIDPAGTPFLNGPDRIGTLYAYNLDLIAGTGDPVSAVPEPATLTMLGTGLFIAARRRRAKTA